MRITDIVDNTNCKINLPIKIVKNYLHKGIYMVIVGKIINYMHIL